MTTSFTVDRKDLRRAAWVREASAALADGEVRMRVDAFALTSNNITYAAFGEAMHYWDFFPPADGSVGCIPVWGFADVVESRCDAVPVGDRYYGYWPMADEAVLQPIRIGATGFSDGAERRRELAAVYNRYLRCAADPMYDAAREAEQALLRPLFVTSFLIDDFLADQGDFGARTVLLSSASSKTAYGTAFCLRQRRQADPAAPQVVGLTSPANAEFCRGLGCYDDVVTYDAVERLPHDTPAVYVDMSGSAPIRSAVHTRFGEQLVYSCSVGGTHWDELGSGKGLAGPRPVLFFAPAQVKKRRSEWGAEGFDRRLAAAWHAFMEPVTRSGAPWLEVVRSRGPEAVETVYRRLLDGTVPANEGHFLSV
jgi:hypothetical protein